MVFENYGFLDNVALLDLIIIETLKFINHRGYVQVILQQLPLSAGPRNQEVMRLELGQLHLIPKFVPLIKCQMH